MKAILIPFIIIFCMGCEKNFQDKTVDLPALPDIPQQPNEPRSPQEPELPSCNKLCSDDTVLFAREDNGHSYLSFTNFGYRGIGRCRGHALVSQKMSLLGSYDDSVASCDLNDQGCIENLKRKIDRVMAFKLTTFKGFSDLYDLSNVPELKAYLMSYVRGTSHRYSANPANIEIDEYDNQKLNVFYEIQRRVQLNQLPYVGVLGRLTGSHALLVYANRVVGGRDVLCARDPNVVLGYAENCDHFFYHEDDKVFYKRYDRDPDLLTSFTLTSDEDRRVKRYRAVLATQCQQEARTANRCK